MRLSRSKILRRHPSLPHPVFRRVPRDGTVGLRNPASCDPVRERGNQVFGERTRATTGFFTDADDCFPNDDFFPDINNLFGDMATDVDTGNTSSSAVPYVFLFLVAVIRSWLLLLEIDTLLELIVVIFMFNIFNLVYFWVKSCGKLLIFPTIQKPEYKKFSAIGFAATLRPPPFEGMHYKRWRTRAILWLTTMNCFDAAKGKPEGELTPAEEKAFQEADTLLRGAILSVLGENIVDSYLPIATGKDM